MSSPRIGAASAVRARTGTVRPLLDAVFGFLVWAAHLLTVYIATAVACQLGLGVAGASTRTSFLATLAIVTVAADAAVMVHTLRHSQWEREMPVHHFRMSVTIGADAIAAVAITWQLLAIPLVPVCT
jgi:hypothetical protein